MTKDLYTNGIDIISIIKKQRAGYLVRDTHKKTIIILNLNGYRLIGDKSSIKDWYKDSIQYIKKNPLSALLVSLGVFFGLTSF